jgi:3-hydroxy-9,10-secoandrosta-1,3,5(10)-triene-9,17-dione monooxygenase
MPAEAESPRRAAVVALRLAERADACLALRRLPDETVADFLASGLHRLAQPVRFGGWGLGVDAQVAAAIELAKGDGSQSWALVGYGVAARQLASFDARAAQEVWGDNSEALVCAALTGRGRIAAKGRGFVASGTWSCAAGIDQAQWLIAAARLEGDEPRWAHFLVPKGAATVLDDWQVAGLVGAGAKSFTLEAAEIPVHRVLEDKPADEASRPQSSGTGVRESPQAIDRFSGDGASLPLAAVPLGIAAAMLEEFVSFVGNPAKRGVRAHTNFATALRIAESRAEIDAATFAVLAAARETRQIQQRGEQPSMERCALNVLAAAYGALAASRAAARMFAGAGAKVILLSNRMQRYLLDISAIGTLEPFAWDSRASTYGRLRLGDKIG